MNYIRITEGEALFELIKSLNPNSLGYQDHNAFTRATNQIEALKKEGVKFKDNLDLSWVEYKERVVEQVFKNLMNSGKFGDRNWVDFTIKTDDYIELQDIKYFKNERLVIGKFSIRLELKENVESLFKPPNVLQKPLKDESEYLTLQTKMGKELAK